MDTNGEAGDGKERYDRSYDYKKKEGRYDEYASGEQS
jgi:hypothetical protein